MKSSVVREISLLFGTLLMLTAPGCRAAAPSPKPQAARRAANVPNTAHKGTGVPIPGASAPSSGRTPEEVRRKGNQLVGQPSLYLEQHAHNPVDWYPWGPAALSKAKRENKPIFLSIGYATCHWCHVMEKESFENDTIAGYLNQHFVSIKVDRERRPDLDALYIDAVGRMGGSTGWPLTVFLTPNLEPFFGGTYFPPEGGRGRPGFMDVLKHVAELFRKQEGEVAARGQQIFQAIQAAAVPRAGEDSLNEQTLHDAFALLDRARDPVYGGFGSRQKFPNTPLLLAELHYAKRTNELRARQHLRLTLEQMLRGGVRDQLTGSFHRYAVDRRWHVPHFEKMLYDNAQLALLYVEAGLWLQQKQWVDAGRAVLNDLIARWQQADGGLVVGFDADDPGGEGAYYSWTPSELAATLGKDRARVIGALFAVTDAGERELHGRSVLHRKSTDEAQALLKQSPTQLEAMVRDALPELLRVRAKRPPPAMDDKELVAWNGLALIALADVGRWLVEPRYVEAAQRVASFITEHCWRGQTHTLLRGLRKGTSLGEGFVDDYALAALGLLHLHAADGDARWLTHAHALANALQSKFYDASVGTFMHSARSDIPSGLPLRRPNLDDGVIPSGANAATLLMLQVGAMSGRRDLHELGLRSLRTVAPQASRRPFASGFLLNVLDHYTASAREVVIAGAPEDRKTALLRAEIRPYSHARILPVLVPAKGADELLLKLYPALRAKRALNNQPTAYVCEFGRCELPTHKPNVLRKQLQAAIATPTTG